MGAVITCSTKYHSDSFPVYHRALHALSSVKESKAIATILSQCMTAIVIVAAVVVFIQAAAPFYNSGMVNAYLEAAPFIMAAPAD